jgi:hypothetical protein
VAAYACNPRPEEGVDRSENNPGKTQDASWKITQGRKGSGVTTALASQAWGPEFKLYNRKEYIHFFCWHKPPWPRPDSCQLAGASHVTESEKVAQKPHERFQKQNSQSPKRFCFRQMKKLSKTLQTVTLHNSRHTIARVRREMRSLREIKSKNTRCELDTTSRVYYWISRETCFDIIHLLWPKLCIFFLRNF